MAKPINRQNMEAIIVQGNTKLLVDEAERFGGELARDRLSSSQIRSAFGTVRQIQATWNQREAKENLRRLLLLKPRLAYQAKRDSTVAPLGTTLTTGIDLVAQANDLGVRKERFQAFADLFEAILAYHAAEGGKKG